MNVRRGFFLLLIGTLLVLAIAMVIPFLQYFLLSVLLAYILTPIQKRLENRLSPTVAAASIVFVALAVIIVPLVFVFRTAVLESVALIDAVQSGEVTLEAPEQQIEELTGVEVNLTSQIQSALEGVNAGNIVGVADTLFHLSIGVGLTVFLLYYFLKDGDKFADWLRNTVPLPAEIIDQISDKGDQIMKAVLVGHILIAVVQGALAGIGLLFAGIPNAVLWTVVMIVLSLLPLVGSFLIWGPAALFLFLQGELAVGGFLLLWGVIVVGFSDDYLRPVVVDRYAAVNPSVIILGVIGGIFVFGAMGIFYGPLIFGLLRVTLDVFREELDEDKNLTLEN